MDTSTMLTHRSMNAGPSYQSQQFQNRPYSGPRYGELHNLEEQNIYSNENDYFEEQSYEYGNNEPTDIEEVNQDF